MGLEQYKGDMAMCCRCSCCKFIPMQRVSGLQYANVCPSIAKYGFHAYSGGGRMSATTCVVTDRGGSVEINFPPVMAMESTACMFSPSEVR